MRSGADSERGQEEFHELCTTAGISPDLVDWVTRWLHDALEIRDLGRFLALLC